MADFGLGLIIALAALTLLSFWLVQFVDLMARRDDEFPGRFDKLIWTAVVVLLPVLGVLAYWFWKPKNYAVRSPESLQRELEALKDQRPRPQGDIGLTP